MKWMLIVLVFGVTPIETGLFYNSLDECLKAEAAMRAEWERANKAREKEYQQMPVSQGFIAKQSTIGTCVPHAETPGLAPRSSR